jgi:glycine C-acetyltransferase
LEAELAAWKQQEACLLFSSGYAANLAILTSLVTPGDVVYSDSLNHASLIDGCRLARTEIQVFPHRDADALKKLLKKQKHGRAFIITDGVFSMDGDIAQLGELVALRNEYAACLIVDDAHGTGVLGETGGGTGEFFGLSREIDISMGTLSKALGSQGGFVTCGQPVRELLVNKARSLIFSTGLSPFSVAAAHKAVEIARCENALRQRLQTNAALLRQELGLAPVETTTQIIPLVLGSNERVMSASQFLRERGFAVIGIRYPSVPEGTARLRITVSAAHNENDIRELATAIRKFLADHPTRGSL